MTRRIGQTLLLVKKLRQQQRGRLVRTLTKLDISWQHGKPDVTHLIARRPQMSIPPNIYKWIFDSCTWWQCKLRDLKLYSIHCALLVLLFTQWMWMNDVKPNKWNLYSADHRFSMVSSRAHLQRPVSASAVHVVSLETQSPTSTLELSA